MVDEVKGGAQDPAALRASALMALDGEDPLTSIALSLAAISRDVAALRRTAEHEARKSAAVGRRG